MPATIVNWAGDDVVSIEEWCELLASATGIDGIVRTDGAHDRERGVRHHETRLDHRPVQRALDGRHRRRHAAAMSLSARMIRTERRGAIVIVTIDNPPVNALPVAGWFALADAIRGAGRDPATHAVIVARRGHAASRPASTSRSSRPTPRTGVIVGVNRGCAETFAAVYDCPVPVIAAVNGFCLGGGIGIAGNADILVASDDATFGVPEVDRGALGTATHLARLVPQHKVRAMFFTGEMVTAADLPRSARASEWCRAPSCSPPRSRSRTRSRRRARS